MNIEKSIENKLISLERDFKERVKAFGIKLIDLNNEMNKKDEIIKTLESQIKNNETKSLEKFAKLESKAKKCERERFSCGQCEFSTTSNQGLKIHIRKKDSAATILRRKFSQLLVIFVEKK